MNHSDRPLKQFLSETLAGWGRAPLSKLDIIPVILIIASIGVLSWNGVRDKSNTVDEAAHILSGHAYWNYNDYRLTPESGMLPNRVAAIPLQFGREQRPIDTQSLKWTESDQWGIARDWWFTSGNDPIQILKQARCSMLLFNLCGMVCIFILSAQLWGRAGGYFSLILAGVSPNFLGHMPLATSDFALAWTLALASVSYSRLLDGITIRRILLAGVTAAMAVLSKQSGLVIGPVAVLLLGLRFWHSGPVPIHLGPLRREVHDRLKAAAWLLLASVSAAIVAYLILWTAYGWRFQAANPGIGSFTQFQVKWEMLENPGLLAKLIFAPAREFHLLPEAFLYGIDFIQSRINRGGFLNGVYSSDGYRLFYVWNFLYKTPPPAILLHITGWVSLALLFFRKGVRRSPALTALLCLAAIYSIVLLTTRMNIGYRHAFPVLLISCIVAAVPFQNALKTSIPWALFLAGMLLGLIPFACMNENRFISYVNFIGGGQANGYRNLMDSSLDWGQDLPAAAEFIRSWRAINPGGQVYLSTFGTVVPEAYGIEGTHFLPFWGFRERDAYLPELGPGLYVVSSTAMAQIHSGWDRKTEIEYQTERYQALPLYERLSNANMLEVTAAATALTHKETATLQRYERIRFRRLIYYLHGRQADRVIHGSMPVYELSESELEGLKW